MVQPTGTTKQKTGAMTADDPLAFSGTRIYIGPNAAKKGLRFGMGFRNGLPAEIKALCLSCPQLADLIVAPAEFAEKRKELSVKGSLSHQALAAFEAYLSKGGTA
ncbi:MAG: hypothetical protein RR091_12915 [Cloacibacillus sp.]